MSYSSEKISSYNPPYFRIYCYHHPNCLTLEFLSYLHVFSLTNPALTHSCHIVSHQVLPNLTHQLFFTFILFMQFYILTMSCLVHGLEALVPPHHVHLSHSLQDALSKI